MPPNPVCVPMELELEHPADDPPMEELPMDELPKDELPKDELPKELPPPCIELEELVWPIPAGLPQLLPIGWLMESSNTPAALTWMNRHFPLGSKGSRYSWRRNRIPLVWSSSFVLAG